MPVSRLHAITWLIWAISAVVCLQTASNPLYVAIVLLIAVLVAEVHRLDSAMARTFGFFLWMGAFFAVVRVGLTVVTTHSIGRVLATVPEFTLPRLLGGFTVGGDLMLEVLFSAAAEAFVVFTTIAVFGAFNAVVSHHELLQSTPRAFHEPGLVVTVGLAFVPSTLESIQATRESDRARTGGVIVRRGRVIRTLIPVLERGLERAVSLSESMDARGFARGRASRLEVVSGWCALAGLLCLASTFVALIGRSELAAAVLAPSGAALLLVAVMLASAGSGRVRYRPRRLTLTDGFVIAAAVSSAVLVGVLALVHNDTLVWHATTLDLPRFDPIVALALLGLAVPAAIAPRSVRVEARQAAVA